ncbi:hypothetical protein Tco_1393172 [Tanacetum coccineum]
MTSSEDVCFDVVKDTKVKVMKSKVHKPHKGKRIKVSTLGSSSAGAGSMLKKLRSFKISGKARDRAESSPSDNKGGKRVVSSSENDVIHKVLSDVRPGSLTNDNIVACFPLNKDSNIIGLNPANDFIKDPLLPLNDPSLNKDSNSIGLSLVASGSNPKDRMDFKFGKVSNSKGILKKPMSPLLNVQLGSDIPNPFVKGVGGNNTEEMALKMEYMPSARSKLDNGTSMDYRVVRANLMRMWKTYGIVDITKTNSGIFYFKFKSEEAPNVLEIAYPPIGNSPAKIGKLEVKYQWKPPLCTHGKTFGHSTLACKVRPRTEEEIATAVLKEAINVNSVPKASTVSNINNDGFVTVGRKNKPIEKNQVPSQVTSQHTGKQGGGNSNFNGQRRFGVFVQRNQVQQKNIVNANKNGTIGKSGEKLNVGNGSSAHDVKNGPLVVKLGSAYAYNKDFRPKVLVQGSSSNGNTKKPFDEAVPISNSFDLLSDEAMDEEYASSIWPKLKGDVDDLMENGIYPSKLIRAEWSLRQMEYFYNNCHKLHLNPAYEDEEDDVNSKVDGVASDMKPEFAVNDAEVLVNGSAKAHDVFNDF